MISGLGGGREERGNVDWPGTQRRRPGQGPLENRYQKCAWAAVEKTAQAHFWYLFSRSHNSQTKIQPKNGLGLMLLSFPTTSFLLQTLIMGMAGSPLGVCSPEYPEPSHTHFHRCLVVRLTVACDIKPHMCLQNLSNTRFSPSNKAAQLQGMKSIFIFKKPSVIPLVQKFDQSWKRINKYLRMVGSWASFSLTHL